MTAVRSRIGTEFFFGDVEYVAQALIGADLFTKADGRRVGGKIIATESYGCDDPFSHCYDGPGSAIKPGAEQMCGFPGTIYFAENNLGCTFNISCGPTGCCSAVLVCALLPFCSSTTIMRARRRSYKGYNRHLDDDSRYIHHLCDGPQNVCDALGITDELYKLSHEGQLTIDDDRFELFASQGGSKALAEPRVGLDKQLLGFRPERASHPDIEHHRLALRRFVLKGADEFPSCLPD
ncbi:3-methyladenine DNA glycosylase Mpg [Bradyrhizobium elkanii]|uniref:DNA-3-methyladenine glycosylase n=1 Tax=Bradyrhizobium elkanii TaxID=29448 RepID=UPI002167A7D9|nr:DNA-3-methyladenine glycosylase [Bradyrhizobium elkanii]MCS3687490.1 3-methyladenine DNA glycosylase Mpg [Bradyrhizobium elkanii]